MTSLQEALAALERKAPPPKRDQRLIILRSILELDGSRADEIRPPDLDLDDVAAHPENYRLEREAVLRFEAPPDYVEHHVEGGQPVTRERTPETPTPFYA